MVPEVSLAYAVHSKNVLMSDYLRCRTPPDKLAENNIGNPRSEEHTQQVVTDFGPETSWSTWGIDADVIVRH